MQDSFTKQKTLQLKGVAILLMLAHHLYTFSDRIYIGHYINSGITIYGIDLAVIIGSFGKICVSIFMFLGGYGLYKSFQKNNFLDKIINLYKKYWKNFLIFIPLGFIFFCNQNIYTKNIGISTRFNDFSFNKLISDFLVLSSNMNGEWWFLKNYFFGLFIGYIFIHIMRKNNNVYKESLVIIVWYILTNGVLGYIGNLTKINNFLFNGVFIDNGYTIMLLVGILFSKYMIFDKISYIFKKYSSLEKCILSLIAIFSIVYIRVFYFDISRDIILTPLFIFFTYNLFDKFNIINSALEILGKNSTNMWLNHSFFCYYYGFFAKVIYYTNNVIISFVTLLLLSLGSALLTDFMWDFIGKTYIKFKDLISGLNIKRITEKDSN